MLLLLLRKKWSSSYAGNSIYWNLFLRFAESVFFHQFFFVCICVREVSNKVFPPLIQVPVPGCRDSSCVLIVHVCLCVCVSVCACEKCVGKVINI